MTLIDLDDDACGTGATMLSSSVHDLVVKRIQSSALLKWQTADPRKKSVTGPLSGSCHEPRGSTKDAEIFTSLLPVMKEDCNDNDDCCSVFGTSSIHHRDSFSCALRVTSCHSRTSTASCSGRVQEKKHHYRNILAQKTEAADPLVKFDFSTNLVDEASCTDRSDSFTCTTASTNPIHQDNVTTISTRKARPARHTASKSPLRRIKSAEPVGERKKAGGKKLRSVVSASDECQYNGPSLPSRPCRATMEADNKHEAVRSSKSKLLSGGGRDLPKRAVSDLGKNSRLLNSDLNEKNSEKRSQIKRSVSSKDNRAEARVSRSSILDLRTLVDSGTNTSCILRSNRKLTGTVSGVDLQSMRSRQNAQRQERRKLPRAISADDTLDQLRRSCHAALIVDDSTRPGMTTRRTSRMQPSKNTSWRNSMISRSRPRPSYDWEQGKTLTAPSSSRSRPSYDWEQGKTLTTPSA
jgi:hypothetical protein